MRDLTLSYLISTKNKLPALKQGLLRLLAQVEDDEEIVVIDGASSDGTVEFLQGLHDNGEIQQFVSEPDSGEAHGWNKALLRARGAVIKPITDDDAFSWPVIRACKRFMLDHSEIDVLATPGFDTNWGLAHPFLPIERRNPYTLDLRRPFVFSGLGLMLRRSSLPLTGLFHTGLISVDTEFALRVSSGPVNLAWCTGASFVRILNPQSLTVTQHPRIIDDLARIYRFYLGAPPQPSPSRALIDRARDRLRPLKQRAGNESPLPTEDWARLFERCDAWLDVHNRSRSVEFISIDG
jgi:glycosyltransferase involved in cell wall biosynthesis